MSLGREFEAPAWLPAAANALFNAVVEDCTHAQTLYWNTSDTMARLAHVRLMLSMLKELCEKTDGANPMSSFIQLSREARSLEAQLGLNFGARKVVLTTSTDEGRKTQKQVHVDVGEDPDQFHMEFKNDD